MSPDGRPIHRGQKGGLVQLSAGETGEDRLAGGGHHLQSQEQGSPSPGQPLEGLQWPAVVGRAGVNLPQQQHLRAIGVGLPPRALVAQGLLRARTVRAEGWW
jgi:hypothetical protein